MGLKEKCIDIESGSKFLLIASLWFVYQAAAYSFSKLCSQLPWDCLPCDITGACLSGDEQAVGEETRPALLCDAGHRKQWWGVAALHLSFIALKNENVYNCKSLFLIREVYFFFQQSSLLKLVSFLRGSLFPLSDMSE